LQPEPLERAIRRKIADRNKRGEARNEFLENLEIVLEKLTNELKNNILGQYLANREPYQKRANPDYDPATIKAKLLVDFDQRWSTFKSRVDVIPGKLVFSLLNKFLQEKYSVSLSSQAVISSFEQNEIQDNIRSIIEDLDEFRNRGIE
jgi:hypothetical protein